MSVRGEFVRIVGDAVRGLRAVDSDAAQSLAEDLQHARDGAAADLAGSAQRVLELCEDRSLAPLGVDDAGERMIAVARIVLGR